MSAGLARTVLVTDYAWESLDLEREILNKAGVSVLEAPAEAEGELVGLRPMSRAS